MKNKVFVSVVTSMMISGTMLSAKEISLQEAVDSIVKEYKVSYISKSKSLKDRKVDDSKMSFGGGNKQFK
ncbi:MULTISPECIES: hypothetical protein [Arcobacteraceae]|uniref:hypothetical protein n=2 Tax=Campylobacterales TaxID=213849 RepID=UPI000DEABB01|nr:hypothetical protein [Arcobacter sp. CECT 9188]RBQ25779.1 hypothetical protein CRU88_10710 [Arcobacter sp. CECT 9188]